MSAPRTDQPACAAIYKTWVNDERNYCDLVARHEGPHRVGEIQFWIEGSDRCASALIVTDHGHGISSNCELPHGHEGLHRGQHCRWGDLGIVYESTVRVDYTAPGAAS